MNIIDCLMTGFDMTGRELCKVRFAAPLDDLPQIIRNWQERHNRIVRVTMDIALPERKPLSTVWDMRSPTNTPGVWIKK